MGGGCRKLSLIIMYCYAWDARVRTELCRKVPDYTGSCYCDCETILRQRVVRDL